MLALSLAPSFLPKIALLHEPKSEELERSQIIHSVHLLPWWNHVSLDTRPELSVGPVLPTWLLNCLASLLSSTLKVQKQKLTFPVCEEKQERKTNKRGSIGGGNSPGHPFCGSWCPHLHHLLWRRERHSQLCLAKVPLCASSIGPSVKFFGFLLSHIVRLLDLYRNLNLCYLKGSLPKRRDKILI